MVVAHGPHVSRLDGSPLKWNQPDPWLPDLVLCHPWGARRLLETLAGDDGGAAGAGADGSA